MAEPSNLVIHANREMDLIGLPKPTRSELRSKDPAENWDRMLRQSVTQMVELFAKQGHSGMSAQTALEMTTQLLQFKPLSPLTNDPEEWHHISGDIAGQPNLWQNKRQPEAFSEDGGKTFYLLEKKTWLGKHIAPKLTGKLRRWVWKHRAWTNKSYTAMEKSA